MSRTCRWLLAPCVLILALAVHATSADAAQTRYVRTTFTSTGPGTASITIESFGAATLEGLENASAPIYVINVPIPAASTATNTASLIRADVDAALPVEYLVTIDLTSPHIVKIERTTGTFTMSIVENVATQIIEEYVVPVPFLGGEALGLLAVLLLASAAWLLRRRRMPAR